MSLTHPQIPALAPQRAISLEGIGAESAITINRAMEQFGGSLPDSALEASRMLVRSEIRAQMSSGNAVVEALAPDHAEIMEDVKAQKVLGEAETTYADERAYEVAQPEGTLVRKRVVGRMALSLRKMQLASEGADQLSAAEALKSLRSIEQAQQLTRRKAAQSRWAGRQLVRVRVSHAS